MVTATLDRFGRIVIPKSVRDSLGLKPGTVLAIEQRDDRVVLRPTDRSPMVEMKDGVLVFTGEAAEDLADAMRRQREQRLRDVSGMGL